jgi:hypothetical protein
MVLLVLLQVEDLTLLLVLLFGGEHCAEAIVFVVEELVLNP